MPVAINNPGGASPRNASSNGSPHHHLHHHPHSVAAAATASAPPRPTTTSRRGGRSRSPVSLRSENPSAAAAAAAAAAAKAYATSHARPSSTAAAWPSESEYLPQRPLPPSSYGNPWPPSAGDEPNAAAAAAYSSRRQPPPPPPPYGYEPRSSSASGSSRTNWGADQYPPVDPHRRSSYAAARERYDGRYAAAASAGGPPPPYGGGGYDSAGQPPPPYHHHHPHHHPHSRYHRPVPSSSSRSSSRPPVLYPQHYHHREPPRQSTAGCITTATPTMHLPPKSPVTSSKATATTSSTNSSSNTLKRGHTVSSVFRGRPEDNAHHPTPAERKAEEEGDDSPSKILVSLRASSTASFEESTPKKNDPTTPTDPNATSNETTTPVMDSSPSSSGPSLLDSQHRVIVGDVKPANSLDMAPSFTLFNQSFDSFGDVQYFANDSSLQADSFGLAQVESVGGENLVLRKDASFPLANSGSLTLGYSPVNSFGNGSRVGGSSHRSMMVVGGHDARSTSPTQVLNMYRSYSSVPRSAASATLEASRSSGGMQMMMNSGSASFGMYGGGRSSAAYDPASPIYDAHAPPLPPPMNSTPPFYYLLRKFREAFRGITFLLPGIKECMIPPPPEITPSSAPNHTAEDITTVKASPSGDGAEKLVTTTKWEPSIKTLPGGGHLPPYGMYGELSPQDLAVARRRVECSICAFGGNLSADKVAQSAQSRNRESIFRAKEKDSATPSPSESPPVTKKTKYEEELTGRYYENDSRLSWEFEEEPPITIPTGNDNEFARNESEHSGDSPKDQEGEEKGIKDETNEDKAEVGDDEYCKPIGSDGGDTTGDKSESSSPNKMRYRCKLCGQPKQNHRCPFQQSLARSIGTMVYPAVNAFTADEPGTIATPLSEMNNFIDTKDSASEFSPHRPTPDRSRRSSGLGASAQVTPESLRSHSRKPVPTPGSSRRGKKRMYSQLHGGDQGDLLFVEAMDLKPEQFRIVSPSRSPKSSDAYTYPALPLPYAQRKRLSDNLFSLSNEVPKLTDECAQVLREAREKDMWDLAVAELMTQVIVVIHCSDRDYRFEGLRQYLLTLGIAC